MKNVLSLSTGRIGLVILLGFLATACSPQASVPSTGDSVPHLDALIEAATSNSMEDIIGLIQFSNLPCTTAEGLGGPPKCLGEEAEGTLVEVLPVLGPEGAHIRRSQIDNWAGVTNATFIAAFQTPESAYSDENFPAGDYSVAFRLPDGVNIAVFQLTEEGIVRIDYPDPSTFQDLLDSSEVIVTAVPE